MPVLLSRIGQIGMLEKRKTAEARQDSTMGLPMARIPALFLGLLACGLVLLLSLNTIAPPSQSYRKATHNRIHTVTGHEGDTDEPTFFCDISRAECPKVNSRPKTGWHGGIPGLPDLHLYSAHLDTRVELRGRARHFARVLGVVREKEMDRLRFFCQLWYTDIPHPIIVEATRREIWDARWDGGHSPTYYHPYLFSCPIPSNVSNFIAQGPVNVSLSLEPCACPSHILSLPRLSQKPRRGFAVCVKGLDFPQDISVRLVEWIEMQYLLGADTVFFYVLDVHPKVDLILRFYRRFRNLNFVKLRLPGRDEPNAPIRRRNYLAKNSWQKRRHELIPYNDCYYRHVSTHNFVLLVDTDEVVVPRRRDSWQQLIDGVVRERPNVLSKYASLAVPNVYFFSQFGSEHLDRTDTTQLRLMTHVTRSANFTRPGFAVKSFFTWNGSLAVFNHYSLVPLYSRLQHTALLSSDIVRLHHYKDACPRDMDTECDNNFFKYTVRDESLWRFRDKLLLKIDETRISLKKLFLVMI
ncbi:uncharacterized protein LOC135391037 [Ornithodoros turicata]|uniref:uncharacterized protein LOC135391037 n=1 Tax=Ornithodoros turicata TaxID=34597 RepID=UPI003138FBEF